MSRTTRDMNTVTGTIMGVSCKVLLYVLVFFLLYLGVTRGYGYGHEIFAPTPAASPPGADYEIVVGEGDSVSEVGKLLEDSGLIKDKNIFVLQAKLYEYSVYPGTYTLNSSENSKDMLKKLDAGGKDSGDDKL